MDLLTCKDELTYLPTSHHYLGMRIVTTYNMTTIIDDSRRLRRDVVVGAVVDMIDVGCGRGGGTIDRIWMGHHHHHRVSVATAIRWDPCSII